LLLFAPAMIQAEKPYFKKTLDLELTQSSKMQTDRKNEMKNKED